ncbi:MAG: hypothetical protein H6738_19060 [Alphaproteobacteria bacterium]|nr:hypothetical protein [Alphaproteobacteria bacterium]MCB9698889.1 hypothetical protein [Alphaproteobacteria bacterium]
MIAAWVLGTASAIPFTVTFCVEQETEFPDAGFGDRWVDDGVNKNARGLFYQVFHDGAPISGHLSQVTGCATETVELASASDTYALRVSSKALIGGLHIESYATPVFDQQTLSARQTWRTPVPATAEPMVLPAIGVWQNLAVATYLMKRSKFHIEQGVSRDCCLESTDPDEYNPDGTCGPQAPADHHYVQIEEPLRLYSHANLSCGQSGVLDSSSIEHVAVGLSGLCRKYVVAHEMGHVVVDMRMGGEEQRDPSGDDDGCAADVRDGTPIPSSGRGQLTKEYLAVALREGWGDFFAYWAWNDKESDCVTVRDHPHDIDLDGTVDNTANGVLDCWGTPYPGAFEPVFPNIVVDHKNWLDDAERECQLTGNCVCERDPDPEIEANRSTIYDVSKMLFRLYAQDLLTEGQLSDLYVDTCPRGWAEDDERKFPASDAEWPIERLRISADANGITSEVESRIDYVEH